MPMSKNHSLSSDYQIYLVGGAIRDALSGHFASDCDFVVVGATPEIMLAQGFRPVGRDFPVFLHPKTQQEYAIARSEKKNGHGYHGFNFYFAPEVSLSEDLARRDLTINAMALALPRSFSQDYLLQCLRDADLAKKVIDPYGGLNDLKHKIFRHVSSAFSDDPVRLLRLARFSTKFPDFHLAKETRVLIKQMDEQGELNHLPAERVWQEYSRAMRGNKPANFFHFLLDNQVMKAIFAPLQCLSTPLGGEILQLLDQNNTEELAVQFALVSSSIYLTELLDENGRTKIKIDKSIIDNAVKSVKSFCQQITADNHAKELAIMLARNFHYSKQAPESAQEWLDFIGQTDVLRRSQRFSQFMLLLKYLQPILAKSDNITKNQKTIASRYLVSHIDLIEKFCQAIKSINYQGFSNFDQQNIVSAIKTAKLTAIEEILEKSITH